MIATLLLLCMVLMQTYMITQKLDKVLHLAFPDLDHKDPYLATQDLDHKDIQDLALHLLILVLILVLDHKNLHLVSQDQAHRNLYLAIPDLDPKDLLLVILALDHKDHHLASQVQDLKSLLLDIQAQGLKSLVTQVLDHKNQVQVFPDPAILAQDLKDQEAILGHKDLLDPVLDIQVLANQVYHSLEPQALSSPREIIFHLLMAKA